MLVQVVKDRARVTSGWTVHLVALVGLLMVAGTARGGAQTQPNVPGFLQRYLGRDGDSSTTYSSAYAFLHHDTRSVVVFISGDSWCGSGGCTALILDPDGSSFRVVQQLTLARLPIYLLPTTTKGWHDLAMPVAGGGIVSEYIGVLKFDGKEYQPIQPRAKIQVPPTGAIPLALKNVGSPLYPK